MKPSPTVIAIALALACLLLPCTTTVAAPSASDPGVIRSRTLQVEAAPFRDVEPGDLMVLDLFDDIQHNKVNKKCVEYYDAVLEVRRKIGDMNDIEKEINIITTARCPSSPRAPSRTSTAGPTGPPRARTRSR